MSLKSWTKLALALIIALLAGCRGSESKKPPIHLNPNMDLQEKYKAQEESNFFEDGMSMRLPVEGTIPHSDMYLRGGADYLKADSAFYKGKKGGAFVTEIPTLKDLGFANEVDMLKRGKERYDIYCLPCHGATGDGKGPVTTFARGDANGFPGVLNFTDPIYADSASVGQIYKAINEGGALMPAYAYQIKVRDRWAVVAYVKVLQQAAAKVAEQQNNK